MEIVRDMFDKNNSEMLSAVNENEILNYTDFIIRFNQVAEILAKGVIRAAAVKASHECEETDSSENVKSDIITDFQNF